MLLSSAVTPPHFERPYALPDWETYSRCEFAAWLYHKRQVLPIVASGGPGLDGGPSAATIMREFLIRAGVPPGMIWTEERSHNTHENALFSAELLRIHNISRIVLVADARSMLRAEASFRKCQIGVVPAPSSYREWGPLSQELLPSWKSIRGNELTLHETLGLLWYRWRGWI